VLRAELAGLTITAIGLVVMLRPMEIMGAAIASLLGYSAVTVTLLYGAWRYTGTSPKDLLVPSIAEFRLRLGARAIRISESSVTVD
jgi:hypothetical protein